MKFRSYGRLDDPIQPEGDNAFMGFSSRLAPENLKQGYAALLCNMRVDQGVAQCREGIRVHNASINLPNTPLHLQFNLDTVASGNQPLLGGSNGVMIPSIILDDNGVEWVCMATQHSLVFWNQDSSNYPVVSIPYPTNEEVLFEDEPFVLQAGISGTASNIIIFRGISKAPLQLVNTVASGTTISASTIPPSKMGLWFQERLLVIKDDYTIAFSNFQAAGTFPATNQVTIGYGNHDPLEAIAPFGEGQVIVFKRNSIHVVTNVRHMGETTTDSTSPTTGNTFPMSKVMEVTRQHGLSGRRSVTAIGDQVFYMSDRGVYSITSGINATPGTATPVQLIKVVDDPLSSTISDFWDEVNTEAAPAVATGIFFNNRYFLALPHGNDINGAAQTRNNKVLVYSLLSKSWESIDYFGDGTHDLYFDEFMIGGMGSQKVLFMGNKEAYIFRYGSGNKDRWGRDGSEGELDIRGRLKTRRYALGTIDVKRWQFGQIHWAHATLANQTPGASIDSWGTDNISYSISMSDPDESIPARTISSTSNDGATRFSMGRARGVGAQIDINTTGRFQIRRVEVNGRPQDGQLHTHI
jgi:hypothetical protein